MRMLAFFLFFPSVVLANTAWWEFCDSCQSDTQFVQSARFAPGEHEIVYVSNRVTNTTRKFHRFFTVEDLGYGYVYMTHVVNADFPASDQQAFSSAITSSRTIFGHIDRPELVGLAPVGSVGSVISDLRFGFVTQAMISALNVKIQLEGWVPDRETVNQQLGLDLGDFGFIFGQGDELRTQILTIRINYPDGSYLQFERHPDGSLKNWSAQDAAGNQIVFIGNNVHGDSLGTGAPYEFGPGDPNLGQAVLDLYQSLNMTRWDCTMQDLPGGAGVRLTCTRR